MKLKVGEGMKLKVEEGVKPKVGEGVKLKGGEGVKLKGGEGMKLKVGEGVKLKGGEGVKLKGGGSGTTVSMLRSSAACQMSASSSTKWWSVKNLSGMFRPTFLLLLLCRQK